MPEARRLTALYSENPGDAVLGQEISALRRTAAAAIAALPSSAKTGPEIEAAEQLVTIFYASGTCDGAPSTEDRERALDYAKKSGPGLLAAMLLLPAWEWPEAPRYDDLPTWLWPAFTSYVFHLPLAFSAVGQAEKYAVQYQRRLEELVRWSSVNRGSSAVKAAMARYTEIAELTPLLVSPANLKRVQELRSRMLALSRNIPSQADIPALPREGRRLRIGFVAREFGPPSATAAVLPWFEHLDASAFETVLYAHQATHTPLEDHCRSRAADYHILPLALSDQVETLLAAQLDVLVLCPEASLHMDDVTALGLHRLAPLQVVLNAGGVTSGSPECDLFVSGTTTENVATVAEFTERLALVPGTGMAFNFEHDSSEPTRLWTRADLGIPETAVVFASTADCHAITPEVQETWVRLLTAVPGSRLLLQPFQTHDAQSGAARLFCAHFDRVLVRHGVAEDHLLVVTEPFASRADAKALLQVATLALDTFSVSATSGLLDALECGLPVVTKEGVTSRSRRGAALLRTLGASALIATDDAGYIEIATRLASDPAVRAACVESISGALARTPLVFDTLAASDSLGHLIETAFDEIAFDGRKTFRSRREPVTCASPAMPDSAYELNAIESARRALRSDPANWQNRHALGCALLEAGEVARASTYLIAALQGGENHAVLWRDVALALRAEGKRNQAIEALETCLRLDPAQGESWMLFIELAESCGSMELAREALGALRANVPDHPGLADIAARLGC
jgi:predicted O-linked N-acetylglucosamine transferase (SPINDLY family)